MRWIKLHESQLEVDQKENNSLEVNAAHHPLPAKQLHPKKQEINELTKKNKEMYENLQRSKAKVSDLTR
jgi:molecular chaperone GrpE (heat shock protein)